MTTSLVLASYSEVEGSGQIPNRCTKLAAKEEIRRYLNCTITHVLGKTRDLMTTDNSKTMTNNITTYIDL